MTYSSSLKVVPSSLPEHTRMKCDGGVKLQAAIHLSVSASHRGVDEQGHTVAECLASLLLLADTRLAHGPWILCAWLAMTARTVALDVGNQISSF